MKCNNGLCFCGGTSESSENENEGKLCCGLLGWKKAVLLIALGDFISVSLNAYGTSGSTLGEVETRLGISNLFNISLNEESGSASAYYSIYVLGILLFVLRLLTIFSLVLGSQNYRPFNVLIWIVCAPIGWMLFFTMQVVLLMRYHGVDNQASKFWRIWNQKNLFSLNSTSDAIIKSVSDLEPNSSAFGQPCINILIISTLSLIFTVLATFYVSIFYRKQKNNLIH